MVDMIRSEDSEESLPNESQLLRSYSGSSDLSDSKIAELMEAEQMVKKMVLLFEDNYKRYLHRKSIPE
jgi:hypothetical protein